MATDPKYIVIDNEVFEIPIIQLKRKGDILDRTATRTQDGVLHRDVIGTYYNYTLNIGQVRDPVLYNKLWWKLTEPTASHMVKLPHDGVEFEGYFSSVQDEVIFVVVDENGHRYKAKGLSCNLTAFRPARVPTEPTDDTEEDT